MNNPPLDFLLVCSGVSLHDFELNRLNAAANLRKHISQINDDLIKAEAEALLARWLMEYRDAILSHRNGKAAQASFEFPVRRELPAAPARAARSKTSREPRREVCA